MSYWFVISSRYKLNEFQLDFVVFWFIFFGEPCQNDVICDRIFSRCLDLKCHPTHGRKIDSYSSVKHFSFLRNISYACSFVAFDCIFGNGIKFSPRKGFQCAKNISSDVNKISDIFIMGLSLKSFSLSICFLFSKRNDIPTFVLTVCFLP